MSHRPIHLGQDPLPNHLPVDVAGLEHFIGPYVCSIE